MLNLRQLIPCLFLMAAATVQAEPIAVTDVAVISMSEEGVQRHLTVIVDEGRIVAIGPADELRPDGTSIVDGSGQYLIPGLAEMHAHIPGAGEPGQFLNRVLKLFVVNGITTIRGMLGHPSHLQLRQKVLDGDVLGPRIYTSGPSLNGRSVSSPEQGRRMVLKQHKSGYDFLKLHPGLEKAEFDAIATAAQKRDMPFAGHVSTDVGLQRALEAGQASIDHLDGYMQAVVSDGFETEGVTQGFFALAWAPFADPEKIAAVADATADVGVWNVPTQSLIEHAAGPLPAADIAAWSEMRYMPEATVRRWVTSKKDLLANPDFSTEVAARAIDVRRKLIKALHDSGAGLLLGSDAPQVFNVPGFATHRELAVLVASGLTPYQALRTGTINPARFFSADNEYGTIEVGKSADMILLEANPLENIENTRRIAGVFLRGRWIDRAEIDSILASLEN